METIIARGSTVLALLLSACAQDMVRLDPATRESLKSTPEIKVTIAWLDAFMNSTAQKRLLNDVDLELVSPDGETKFPWTLNPAGPFQDAVRDKANDLDNVEQVLVDAPAAGIWTIRVKGTAISDPDLDVQGYVIATSHLVNRVLERFVLDSGGGIHAPAGLDPTAAVAHKEKTGSVVGLPGTQNVSNQDLLLLPCDILIPAALENQLRADNAGRVRARIVVEAANGPTTPEADAILARRGIPVAPDILCNSGGVIVSYFEWVQARDGYFWSSEEVAARLRRLLERAFGRVQHAAREHDVTWREAATMLAVARVAEATLVRGIYP